MGGSTDHVLMQNQIVGLLRSHAVLTIRFVAESVRIDHRFWSHLADLVLADRLHVGVDPGLRAKGLRGTYDTTTNLLNLAEANLGTTSDKSFAVHELAHAAVDLMNLPYSRGLHRTEMEAIGYIAQRVYSRHLHADPLQRHWPHLVHVADAIAHRVVAAEPHLYHVNQDEIRSLRNAIGQHPQYHPYRGSRGPSDGIP